MEEWGLGFLIKVVSDKNILELVQKLNASLETTLTFRGGKCRDNYISIYPNDFYDPSKPSDPANIDDNCNFEIFVALDDYSIIPEETPYQQIELAQKIKQTLEQNGCRTWFIFTFELPDGRDPDVLLNV